MLPAEIVVGNTINQLYFTSITVARNTISLLANSATMHELQSDPKYSLLRPNIIFTEFLQAMSNVTLVGKNADIHTTGHCTSAWASIHVLPM